MDKYLNYPSSLSGDKCNLNRLIAKEFHLYILRHFYDRKTIHNKNEKSL